MSRSKPLFVLCAALVLGLSACTSAPPATSAAPTLTFEQMAPVSLNVSKVEVYDEYKPADGQGTIEYEFSTPPAKAAHNLITKTLRADGDSKILRVFIDDASVKAQKLAVRKDFWGNFDREPAEKFDARVVLRFELVEEQAPDIVVGHASVISDRTKTLLENTSLSERDRAYLDLTEDLMNDLYAGFGGVVKNTFGFEGR